MFRRNRGRDVCAHQCREEGAPPISCVAKFPPCCHWRQLDLLHWIVLQNQQKSGILDALVVSNDEVKRATDQPNGILIKRGTVRDLAKANVCN